jgi:hypothetical protein
MSRTKKDTSIKTLIQTILNNSTAQALFNLVHTPHLVLKLFLALCIISTIVASSFAVISSILNYYQFEVTTVSRQVFETTTYFPRITLCNLNQFTTVNGLEFLKKVAKNSKILNADSAFDSEKTKNITLGEKIRLYGELAIEATSLMLESKLNFSHSLEDILLSCYFNNQACNMNDFLSYVDPCMAFALRSSQKSPF